MSQWPNDPSDPDRRQPLDYHRPQPRVGWSVGTGCLIALAVVVLIIGVFVGTCMLVIRH